MLVKDCESFAKKVILLLGKALKRVSVVEMVVQESQVGKCVPRRLSSSEADVAREAPCV
jgi:hypothetical protein